MAKQFDDIVRSGKAEFKVVPSSYVGQWAVQVTDRSAVVACHETHSLKIDAHSKIRRLAEWCDAMGIKYKVAN